MAWMLQIQTHVPRPPRQPDIAKQTSVIYRFIARDELQWPIWFRGSGKMFTQYKKWLVHSKVRLNILSYTVLKNNLRLPVLSEVNCLI